ARERAGELFTQILSQAEKHLEAKDWEKAQKALTPEPDFTAEMLAELRRRQDVVVQKQEQAKQQLARQRLLDSQNLTRKRLADFQKPYNDALFFRTQFTGLSLAESRATTLDVARPALAIYPLNRT